MSVVDVGALDQIGTKRMTRGRSRDFVGASAARMRAVV
jgi:hypothetical protein